MTEQEHNYMYEENMEESRYFYEFEHSTRTNGEEIWWQNAEGLWTEGNMK